MSEDLEQKILDWVEVSGRAMEMRVARTAKKSNAEVEQSFNYEDPQTKKHREGDVLASYWWDGRGEFRCRIAATIECKNSNKKPWVAFIDNDDHPPISNGMKDWTVYAHNPADQLHDQSMNLWLGHPPFSLVPVATHIVEGMGSSSANPANDAIRQALSAGEGVGARFETATRTSGTATGIFVLAVVVTGAPLYTCTLDQDAHVKLDRASLLQVREHLSHGRATRVWVMTEDVLPTYLAGIAECASRAGEAARFYNRPSNR